MRRWTVLCWACFRTWECFTKAEDEPKTPCPYCGSDNWRARLDCGQAA